MLKQSTSIIIISLFIIFSCNQIRKKGFDYQTTIQSDTSFYFPQQFKNDTEEAYVLQGMTHFLKSMNEKNLCEKMCDIETFRFSYWRAFNVPIIVKLTSDSVVIKKDFNGIVDNSVYDISKLPNKEYEIMRASDDYDSFIESNDSRRADSIIKKFPILKDTAYISELSRKTYIQNIDTHKLVIYSKSITKSEYKEIVQAIDRSEFWTMKNLNHVPTGLDGSSWLLEANTRLGYNFVYFWSPSNEFRSLCKRFLKYTDLKDTEIY